MNPTNSAATPPPDGPQRARPLALLRGMIDAIDRDVLQLLSRRMAIVAEIADYKRANHVRIRDLKREAEVLEDRCRRAEQLGVPRAEVESIYRLIMLYSRDQQAALRAEVPPESEPKSVAVIGGKGRMGALLGRLFADLGQIVLIADVDTPLTPRVAAETADVVIISVPIETTEQVIRDIGPHVRPDALLMDVTSIKQKPLEAMLASTQASVLGTHPMFGPGVHSLQGQRVTICPGRGDAWRDWVVQMLAARGLIITHASAEEHDRAMALVQVLTHFQTEVLGAALARTGTPLSESLRFTSPAYLMELYVTARHFAQEPRLYGPIQMNNPRTQEVVAGFRRAVDDLQQILVTHDQARFSALFDEVRKFFGDFTQEALEKSSFLIDRLVERS